MNRWVIIGSFVKIFLEFGNVCSIDEVDSFLLDWSIDKVESIIWESVGRTIGRGGYVVFSFNRRRFDGETRVDASLIKRFRLDDWGSTTRGCWTRLSVGSSSMVQLWLSMSSSSSSDEHLSSLNYQRSFIQMKRKRHVNKPQTVFTDLLDVMQLINRRCVLATIINPFVNVSNSFVLKDFSSITSRSFWITPTKRSARLDWISRRRRWSWICWLSNSIWSFSFVKF